MDLDTMRHSLSHIMASAVKEMFPSVKLGIGPATDEGFYYDFLMPPGQTLTPDTLAQIDARMKELISADMPFVQSSFAVSEALSFFEDRAEEFKIELIRDLEANGEDEVSIFAVGEFTDLCSGPHVPSTRHLRGAAFSLDRIAGAYWRGSEKNPMMQRVYALAFRNKKELAGYTKRREEAMARDHRKLGAELDLFATSDLVGKGLPLLLPKGATLRRILERFIVDEEVARGYQHVYSPDLGRKRMYQISGHWDHYQDHIYPPIMVDGEEYVLRPMTCPHHFMVYAAKPRSYRELPVRLAEMATQYRKEDSGTLTGLIRVMSFHLSDSHILCTPDQLHAEFLAVVDLVDFVMKQLGIRESISFRASLRDEQSEKYVDNPALWKQAEKVLLDIMDELKIEYETAKGEAAFYGPKLDIQMKNVLGKEDTVITIQIDFALPERFGLTYVDASGAEERPVAIHRSSIGCLERTMAFLIEHYAGAFPSWLAPIQVRVLTITDDHLDFANEAIEVLRRAGIRCELDARNEKIGKKVREARLQRVPYIATIGAREVESQSVSVRNRDSGNQQTLPLKLFVERARQEAECRSLALSAEKESNDTEKGGELP